MGCPSPSGGVVPITKRKKNWCAGGAPLEAAADAAFGGTKKKSGVPEVP